MAWRDSGPNRGRKLPGNWRAIRGRVFRRDGYRCTATDEGGERCTQTATDCDHVGDRDDHSLSNLTSLCPRHHRAKTGRQGAAANAEARARTRAKWDRREEHPGLNW